MKKIEVKNRTEWRNWLKNNHFSEKEIWLIYFKKHTSKPTVTYLESVEEAICFGWIDGIKKRIDDERYTHRFSPRRKSSKWSSLNIDIAKRMIKEERMTTAGLNAYNQRKEYDKDFLQSRLSKNIKLDPKYEKLIKENETAWINFINLPLSHKQNYILWLNSAKKEVTKLKRIKEAITLLEKNKKLGMK